MQTQNSNQRETTQTPKAFETMPLTISISDSEDRGSAYDRIQRSRGAASGEGFLFSPNSVVSFTEQLNNGGNRLKNAPIGIFDPKEHNTLLKKPFFEGGDGGFNTQESSYGSEEDDHDEYSVLPDNPIYRNHDILSVLWQISRITVPSLLSGVMGQLTYLINFLLIANIDDKSSVKTAALGLGHSMSQAFGVVLFLGLNSSLATQISQAYGQGKLKLCGQYVMRAQMNNLMLFVPIAFLMAMSGHIFQMIGQPAEVGLMASQFLWVSLPHILFTEIFDVKKQQLVSYRLSSVQMFAQLAGTAIHVPLAFAVLEMYPESVVVGIGIATSISSFIKLMLCYTLSLCYEDVRNSVVMPSFGCYRQTDQQEFLDLQIPSMVMFCSEGWAFQLQTIIAGLISVQAQAAMACCAIVSTILFMVGAGFAESSSALIGNMIGANRVGFAWHYAQVLSGYVVIVALLFQFPLFFFLKEISFFLSKDEEVRRLLLEVLPLVNICFFFDAIQSQRQGVIRGLGLQGRAAWITFLCYFGITIPVGCAFAFNMKLGIEGLRAGVLVGQLVLVTLYSILIDCVTNWQSVADRVQTKLASQYAEILENEHEDLMMDQEQGFMGPTRKSPLDSSGSEKSQRQQVRFATERLSQSEPETGQSPAA